MAQVRRKIMSSKWCVAVLVAIQLSILILTLATTSKFNFMDFCRENRLVSTSRNLNISAEFKSQRNLIMGTATSLPIGAIWRFLRSARSTCSSCSIALIIHQNTTLSNDLADLSMFFNVTWLIYEHFKISKQHPQPHRFIHRLRWNIYEDYLNFLDGQEAKFDNVFLTDVRDVIFQANIFDYMPEYGKGLYVFAEAKAIKSSHFNSDRLRRCFGENIVNTLGNKSILCAGTTLGSWVAIRHYVITMRNYIVNNSRPECANLHNDQPFHNYIIYLVDLSDQTPVHRISHDTGFVGTMALARTVFRNRFGLVLNSKGHPYAVVHQFDRSKQLTEQYDREFQLLPDNLLNIRV